MLPVIVGIVGHSNTGKTTLIEYLVKNFRKDGFKVGTLKHASHGFEVDKIGSDSYRHRQAGADIVCLHSKKDSVIFRKFDYTPPPEFLYSTFLREMDILLVEGFRRMKIPHFRLYTQNDTNQIKSPQHNIYELDCLDIFKPSARKKVYCQISELVSLHKNFSIAILAGGLGKRIGGNKPVKKILGTTLLEFLYKKLEHLSEDIFIVTKKNVKMHTMNCKVFYDISKYKKRSAIVGVLSALRYAKFDNVLILGCDMPLISEDLIRLILMSKVLNKNCEVVVPLNRNKPEPLCALYSKNSFVTIEMELHRSLSIVEAYKNINLSTFEVPKNLRYNLLNVNNTADLRLAEKILTGQ